MEKKDIDLDVTDPNCQELNSARLSRYEIVDILYKDGFEETAAGMSSSETSPKGPIADGQDRW
jgi:RNA polymerase-associated protein RTF1